MNHLATKIFIAMLLGIILGVILHHPSLYSSTACQLLIEGLQLLGKIFLVMMKMLVVPIVLVSLVCGMFQITDGASLGRVAGKSIVIYLLTTVFAIVLALFSAWALGIGGGVAHHLSDANTAFTLKNPPLFKDTLLNIFPSNPFTSLSNGNLLQIIFFALLFGFAINLAGKEAEPVKTFFNSTNTVLIKLVMLIMAISPYGVFCLITALFANTGFSLINQLLGYFLTVSGVLIFHWLIVYGLFITLIGKLNPYYFYKKVRGALIFAFSISSSNAAIPVTLDTCENKLGVSNATASFIIPLGATINMDGTAIMQGVASVFIANLYGIHLGLSAYLMIIAIATLASIGTAGIPSAGLITLTMVFQQVGLPTEGIAIIFGVDRLLDMLRTAVNITGDCMVACLVAKSENKLDMQQYNE